jgi:hypothetical protein
VNWALIDLLRESTPLYVAMEVAHTLGFIVLVGAVFFFDLRILGFARTLPVRALAKLLLPWSWGALLVIVPTGLAMFAVNADVLLDDRAFKYKMGLLLAAGLNAIFFLTGPYQTARQWDVDVRAPAMARLSAAASLLLWTGVITCGRLLAYA